MKRTTLAVIAPPVAVLRFGAAEATAGPIGVFWLAGLVSLFYGLTGGTLGELMATRWVLIGLGIVLWIIATVWTRLVIGAVDSDVHHDSVSPRDHKIEPSLNEPDPLNEVRKGQ